MTAGQFLAKTLDPGLAWCTILSGWNVPSDARARVLLLAIAGQESGWTARVQQGDGPAHGFWQFERAGGVAGVLTNRVTKTLAGEACLALNVTSDAAHVWNALATERGDRLAVAFARLLLWSDPAPLPSLSDSAGAYAYYLRLWRPGRPRPKTWAGHYSKSLTALSAQRTPPHDQIR